LGEYWGVACGSVRTGGPRSGMGIYEVTSFCIEVNSKSAWF